jgi:thiosulfate/3-mercaptopyruvate sulfurtransferase
MINALISVEQLVSQLNHPDLIILDASIAPIGSSSAPNYCWPTHVIPHARRFNIEQEFCDLSSQFAHTMPTEQQFNRAAQLLGINQQSKIVIYDDQGIFSSARAWWMFKAMGHQQVSVLNGGLTAWRENHYPLHSAQQNQYALGDFQGVFNSQYFCQTQQVVNALTASNAVVLDARTSARFCGDVAEPRPGLRSGHMPGAKNLPYNALQNDGKMLPIEQLAMKLAYYVNKQQSVISTCGSGITACVLALAAYLCEYPEISVYDGSWTEWAQDLQLPCQIGPS